MDAIQEKLYNDFRHMADSADAVEIDDTYFVRYFNYNDERFSVTVDSEDGTFEIYQSVEPETFKLKFIDWDDGDDTFVMQDTDGYEHNIRFMSVSTVERA